MWARFHGIKDPKRMWAIPFWVTIAGLVSLSATISGELWIVSAGITGFAFTILILSLLLWFPYKLWEEDAPLRELRDEQISDKQKWLYLTVDKLELNEIQGYSEREIQIEFSIYSSLVFDFQPHDMWLNLRLRGYQPEVPLLYIRPTPKFYRGRQYNTGTKRVTINDDSLFRNIDHIRRGNPMEKELMIEIQPQPGERTFILSRNF